MLPSHISDSIVSENMERRATGWYLEGFLRRPPLKIGVMWVSFQLSGSLPWLSECEEITVSGVAIIEAVSLTKEE
ncbi:unnamed protein product [Schistosoma margrebowiei]|uniref:Uncharacterized protein n=1 Tax=Schistosoma margrebowiei TaxID=48269 RepID=A0A183MLY1_9TREM|nr:unnamed protein product [Schistosoma margrebowiei]